MIRVSNIIVIEIILAYNWGFRCILVMVLLVPLLVVLVGIPANLSVLLRIIILILILITLILILAVAVLVVAEVIIVIVIHGGRRIIIISPVVHSTVLPFVPRPINWAIIIWIHNVVMGLFCFRLSFLFFFERLLSLPDNERADRLLSFPDNERDFWSRSLPRPRRRL